MSKPNSSPSESEMGDDRGAPGYSHHDLLMALLNKAPVSIYFKDQEGRFLLGSQSVAQRLGSSDIVSLIGRHDRDFFDPIHADKASADEQMLLDEQVEVIDCTEEEVWPDGRSAWVTTVKLPLRDEDGAIVGTFGVSMDISAQKRAEEELRTARDEAEAVGAELEATLEELIGTQNQLLQAQKLEAVGQLSAGVAHEINTPIQYVNDNTRFIADNLALIGEAYRAAEEIIAAARDAGVATEKIARFDELSRDSGITELLDEMPDAAEETLEGGLRIAEIVRALKAFAHPGSSQKNPVDLNEVVDTTVVVSRNEWKYVAEVETELDECLPTVEGHAGQLHQALLILIVNAAQAIEQHRTGDEKGTITVGTRSENGHVDLSVTDTGGGVPPEIADRIFEPFFTTKDVGVGSGQGLSLAHGIVVEQHNGSITFASEPGLGATFTIRLPLPETK